MKVIGASVALLRKTDISYGGVMRCLADDFLPWDAADFGAVGYRPCGGAADGVFVHARHDLTPTPIRRFREATGIEIVQHENHEPLVGCEHARNCGLTQI